MHRSTSEGCADQPQLVLLYFMSQLLLRELAKCHRLVQLVPMDMTSYYGTHILKKTLKSTKSTFA